MLSDSWFGADSLELVGIYFIERNKKRKSKKVVDKKKAFKKYDF